MQWLDICLQMAPPLSTFLAICLQFNSLNSFITSAELCNYDKPCKAGPEFCTSGDLMPCLFRLLHSFFGSGRSADLQLCSLNLRLAHYSPLVRCPLTPSMNEKLRRRVYHQWDYIEWVNTRSPSLERKYEIGITARVVPFQYFYH